MKITVCVQRVTYGHVEIEVPENSVISDVNASNVKKRREAKKMAESLIRENKDSIIWEDDPDFAESLNVENGYWVIEE